MNIQKITKLSRATKVSGALSAAPTLLLLCILVTGCSHHHPRMAAPPPPELGQPFPSAPSKAQRRHGGVLSSQVGLASWYGAPYHNARGANGKIYNQNAMTAANRTLPLGTVVRVTNLTSRQSAVVTITDRGPFVPGRIIDLSRAAALKTGVWRTGTARVRVDVLRSPPSAAREARWCVQIGVFHHSGSARKLRDHLQRRYPRANVIDFKGATGYWVRIRPDGESHREAMEVARTMRLTEGDAYVVRLD
ncbi:MAG: septal ring lytic transglycosylase RlpA family protein [Acidobacteriaceae bacterium]